MGIKGLWKEVQPVCRPAHISQFRGQRVGVDAYCWLHRAVLASTMPLATGKADDKFITMFVSRVELLQRYGVTPVIIFDGASMPMKAGTDEHRHQNRDAARAEGLRLLQQGHSEEAFKQLGKSIDVSTEIAFAVLTALKDRDVECIVAPYEADAQLAHLCREGYIQAVISEDSDLMVYKCNILLAKMDGSGNCDAIHIRDIPKCVGFTAQQSHEAFITMCILSGCDYVPSLPSIGIKTAQKLVASCRSIPDLIATLQSQHGFTQRELGPYEEAFHKALYCFTHHLVYDPILHKVIPFTPFPAHLAVHNELIGDVWEPELARAVCEEHTHDPCTLLPYVGKHKDSLALYMKTSKKGQRSLTEFSAFERYKANRIVLRQAPEGSWAAAGASTTATPVTGFAGFDNNDSGPPTVVYTKSKYFGGGSKSVQNTSSLRLSHLVADPTTLNDPMAAARGFFEEMEDGLPPSLPASMGAEEAEGEDEVGLAEDELLACPSSSSEDKSASQPSSPRDSQAKVKNGSPIVSMQASQLTPPPPLGTSPLFSQILANAQPVRVGLQQRQARQQTLLAPPPPTSTNSPIMVAAEGCLSSPTTQQSTIMKMLSPTPPFAAVAAATPHLEPPSALPESVPINHSSSRPSPCPHNNPLCTMSHSSFYRCFNFTAKAADTDGTSAVGGQGLGSLLAMVADDPTPIRGGAPKRGRSAELISDPDGPNVDKSSDYAFDKGRRTEPHLVVRGSPPSTAVSSSDPARPKNGFTSASDVFSLYQLGGQTETSPPTKTLDTPTAPTPPANSAASPDYNTKTNAIHSLAQQWRTQQLRRPNVPTPATKAINQLNSPVKCSPYVPLSDSDDNSNSMNAAPAEGPPLSVSGVTASTRKALELMAQMGRGGAPPNGAQNSVSPPATDVSASSTRRPAAAALETISKMAASRSAKKGASNLDAFARDRAAHNASSAAVKGKPPAPSASTSTPAAGKRSVDELLNMLAFKKK